MSQPQLRNLPTHTLTSTGDEGPGRPHLVQMLAVGQPADLFMDIAPVRQRFWEVLARWLHACRTPGMCKPACQLQRL